MKLNKQFFAIILFLTAVMNLTSKSFPGDVNGDGKEGASDIVAITNVIIVTTTDAAAVKAADVNNDGIVNIADIVAFTNNMGDYSEGLLDCPDDHHPHMIDLGLPSGTRWSCCNVGAHAPEESGEFFAWGETQTKSVYKLSNYTLWHDDNGDGYDDANEYVNIGSDIAGTKYDAAVAVWGAPWKMPTNAHYKELMTSCSSEWTTRNGVNGRKFTGPNGGTIFLPAAGINWRSTGTLDRSGTDGHYWSSDGNENMAGGLVFRSGNDIGLSVSYNRYYGLSVRPMAEKKKDDKPYLVCPDSNHPHIIDLGLPSGTKWACCNVGAQAPEEYGGCFAWGETNLETKSVYNWDTYQYGDNIYQIVDIGSDIAGTDYDAATVNWGSPWQMPTQVQFRELINNCTSVWTTQSGVSGRKFTGPNGGAIFLPAAGLRRKSDYDYANRSGHYWSSLLDQILKYKYSAMHLEFNSDFQLATSNTIIERTAGLSVRAVRQN